MTTGRIRLEHDIEDMAGIPVSVSPNVLVQENGEWKFVELGGGDSEGGYSSSDFDSDFDEKTTDDLAEGSANLYYTQTRFDAAFGAKDTDDLSEGASNLYHTDERVDDRVAALLVGGTNITLTYDDGAGTLTIDAAAAGGASQLDDLSDVTLTGPADNEVLQYNNGTSQWVNRDLATAGIAATGHTHTESDITDLSHYTSSDFDTDFGGKSTTDLSEGTNLYWTATRFDNAFAAKDTDDLSEGVTNLYFTDERVDDRVAALLVGGANIVFTYDDVGNALTAAVSPQGAGSGLNADLLDGNHASAFATSGHNHDHGALTGLGDDDHPQYAEIAAAETISGTWTFNTQPSGIDHGALNGLGDDDHPQYGHLSQNETVSGRWTVSDRILLSPDAFLSAASFSGSALYMENDSVSGILENVNVVTLSGIGEMVFSIDANNNTTNRKFYWGHNDPYPGAGTWTQLMSLSEEGVLSFGSAEDVNLYRDSANVLATDDDFHLKGTHLRVIQGSGYGQVEATSWSRTTLLTQNLSYDGSGYPPDNMLYIDDTATSSQAGLMFMLQSNGNRFEWWFADAVDPGDAGAIAPTFIAARMSQSDGVFELLSDVNHLRIRNVGDAIITLDADTANADEQANPWIQFYQDGQLIDGIIGFTGGSNQDPTGATYTGMINNSMLINSSQALQLGSADTLRITIPTTMNGIEFGPAKDTNLYRNGANVLKTDDDFHVAGTLNLDSPGGRLVIPVGANMYAT